jgi:RNA polymerase primary sigma factor
MMSAEKGNQDLQSGSTLPPLVRMAAITGAKATIVLHLLRGMDVNATDYKGKTPLILSAAKGHVEICKILLEGGADPYLRDAEGNDALSTAINSGQKEIEELIRIHLSFSAAEPEQNVDSDIGMHVHPSNNADAALLSDRIIGPSLEEDVSDLSLWEEDIEPIPPPDDPACVSGAKVLQEQIFGHIPVDTDEDWLEVDVELPELYALRRRKIFDEEEFWLISAKKLILDGLINGWVSEKQVANIIPPDEDDCQLPNVEFETAIQIVIGDIGIVLDDIPDTLISLSPVEEDENLPDDKDDIVADEAITFLEDLQSYVNDPLAQYYRELGSRPKLTRDEEIFLAKEITEGTRNAFEAITQSPAAVAEILESSARIEQGDVASLPIISASIGGEDDQWKEHAIEDDNEEYEENKEKDRDIDVRSVLSDVPSDFADKLSSVRNLYSMMTADHLRLGVSDSFKELRDKIISLGLSPRYVSRLESIVKQDEVNSEIHDIMSSNLARVRAAKWKLAESHFRLVIWVARKYRERLPFMDLVQEGNLGLLKAIDRFDPDRGAKFSTYAVWWIRQSITRAIVNNQRLIRLPVHMAECVRQVEKATDEVVVLTGQNPAAVDLANLLELPVSQVLKVLAVPDDPISIDTIADEWLPLAHFVENSSTQDPEEIFLRSDLENTIEETLKSLPDKEAEIIQLRFGINADRDYTLEEIGQIYGVTRERIRQLEKAALHRLRHPSRIMNFRCFCNSAVIPGGSDL